MKLSEMRQLLAERGLQLTKSLGQNFLHDANQLRRIVEAAECSPEDRVLEIGPGLGPLTALLLQHAGEVVAIEKDHRLVEILRERFVTRAASETFPAKQGASLPESTPADETGRACSLRLLHDDALAWLRDKPRDWTGWKLVSNLPYSVASPILVELAQSEHGPQRMVATLQLEVARRLAATPESDDYGVLSLLVQLHYEPRNLFKIPRSCFFPEPDVDSACVTLQRRPEAFLAARQRDAFNRVVKRAFSQRRKKMFKLLKADWPEPALAGAFHQLGLSPDVRAEKVSLEQFVRLTQVLAPPA
jgi:16S rRNA (adenine1518-N6/adenine1519-N6)-dimethyltransferase